MFIQGPIIRKKQDPSFLGAYFETTPCGQENLHLVVSGPPWKIPERGSDKERGLLEEGFGKEG